MLRSINLISGGGGPNLASVVDPEALFLANDLDWLGKPDREVEDQWIERKQTFEASEIARQISSFANGQAPGGLIIVGVSPEGELVGLGSQRAKVNDGLPRLGWSLTC